MSRPKQAGAYPTFMLDILDRLSENPDVVIELTFPSKASANSFRLDFYCFRTAAINEGLEKAYPDMKAITLRLSDEGVLTFGHRDHTPTSEIVAKGLQAAAELASQKALQRASQRNGADK